jgi:hypothetical protein
MIRIKNSTKKLPKLLVKDIDVNSILNDRAKNVLKHVSSELKKHSSKYEATVVFKVNIVDFETEVKSDNENDAREVEKILNDLIGL